MFDLFHRSWELTKLSLAVVRADKEMLAFPLLAGVFSVLFAVALVFPTVFGSILLEDHGEIALGMLEYVVLFITYAGIAFIATFFNVCVVYTTKTRFEGGDATFFESLAFAASRVHLILSWSLVSATVGLLLHIIDRAGERFGVIGRIVVSVVVGLLGAAWSVLTIFVVPIMVYEEVGPIEAIKRSTETLRRTWGESLMRYWGLGLMQFLFFFVGVLVAVPLFIFSASLGPVAMIAAGVTFALYLLLVTLIFQVANSVYSTALYVYAAQGQAPGGFEPELLQATFYRRDRD